jgi:hypothetical protein
MIPLTWRSMRSRKTALAGTFVALALGVALLASTLSTLVSTFVIERAHSQWFTDNRRVILQGWIAESVTLWGLAALVVAVTGVDADADVTAWVHRVAALLLAASCV